MLGAYPATPKLQLLGELLKVTQIIGPAKLAEVSGCP